MSSLETRKIEPQSSTTVTLGEAGDTVAVPTGAIVKTNTVKDAGGNTLFTSDGAGTLSSVNSAFVGSMTFISSQTASSSSSIEFTSGLDSTYDEYVFFLVNIHPSANGYTLRFQGSTDSNTTFQDMTTTSFYAYHDEIGTSSNLAYYAAGDVSDGTPTQLTYTIGNEDDECLSGELHLFAPASTTYVTQFYARTSAYGDTNEEWDVYSAGYLDTTTAIDSVKFDMSSGNIDAGSIYLYGIS